MAAFDERVDGKTIFGNNRDGAPQPTVSVNPPLGLVSALSLVDTAGNEYFLWFDTSGKLRTATAIPANPNTGGTVVGTQS